MIQNVIVMIIVVFAFVYLFTRFLPIQSQFAKKQKGSCACDGCPIATQKKISL